MSGIARRLAEAANEIMNPQPVAEAFKTGDKVKVPHKGKMVSGKIVRFDNGGSATARQSGGGYVVDVGEPASILVPKEKVQKEAVEQIGEAAKTYRVNPQIGKSRHSVSFHGGVKVNKDGSPFFDLRIFKSDKDKAAFIRELEAAGYIKEETEQIDEISKATKDAYVAKRGSQLSSMLSGHLRGKQLTGPQQANAVKGIKRATGKKEAVDVGLQNSLNIARKTVKMNNVFVKVMGGMTTHQAWELLLKHGTQKEKKAAKAWLSSEIHKNNRRSLAGMLEAWKSLKKTKADLAAIRATGKKVSVQHGEGDTLYRVSNPKKVKKEEVEASEIELTLSEFLSQLSEQEIAIIHNMMNETLDEEVKKKLAAALLAAGIGLGGLAASSAFPVGTKSVPSSVVKAAKATPGAASPEAWKAMQKNNETKRKLGIGAIGLGAAMTGLGAAAIGLGRIQSGAKRTRRR